jgi:hypothetical protein
VDAPSGSSSESSSFTITAYSFAYGGFVHRCGFGKPSDAGNEKSKMYSSSEIVRSASSTTGTPSPTFASASSRVGSSRCRPLMKTISASSITAASAGAGSKV